MATVPIREDYATERDFAEAFAAFGNLEGARRLASLNLSNDDGQNSGSVRTAADSGTSTNMTQTRYTGQQSIQESTYLDAPGARKTNVLSQLSSYTYSLTLYMVSTAAQNEFVSSGGKFPANRPDVFIVAQSAGVNNRAESRLITKSRQLGPGQTGNDYYIDDLTMTTYLPGNSKTGATTTSLIKFKIIEPLGFSFVGDLSEMSSKMNQFNGTGAQPGKFDQYMIIGIKFYGYDVNGVPVKSSDPLFANFVNGATDTNSVAERYFGIMFSKFEYSIDERSTEYSIEAAITSDQMVNGQINGATKGTASLTGRTVSDFLVGSSSSTGLMPTLTKKNQDIRDKGYTDFATTYSVVFLDQNGKPDPNGAIATATLPNNYEVNLELAPMSPAEQTSDVTVKNSVNAKTVDTTKQTVTVKAGASIVSLIDKLITESSYTTNALNASVDQSAETSSKDKPGKLPFKSFTINTVFKPKGKDPKTNYQYGEIIYEIMPKDAPITKSQYVEKRTPYRGPFKYYEYMFTGKNTEVLKYEQAFNAQYFVTNATTDSKNIVAPDFPNNGIPTMPQGTSAGDTTGIKSNQGAMIAQNVRTNLYSLKDQAVAKIKIIGDPDYFMSVIGVSHQKTDSSGSKYYHPDGSANPFGSQILIEIRFNSPDDYTDKGLLDVRNNIQFYESQNYEALRAAKIYGVVYLVHTVESNMSKGAFTQTLDMFIVPDKYLLGDQSSSAEGRQSTGILPGPTTAGGFIGDEEDIRTGPSEFAEEQGSQFQNQLDTIGDGEFADVIPSPNDDKNPKPPSIREALTNAAAQTNAQREIKVPSASRQQEQRSMIDFANRFRRQ